MTEQITRQPQVHKQGGHEDHDHDVLDYADIELHPLGLPNEADLLDPHEHPDLSPVLRKFKDTVRDDVSLLGLLAGLTLQETSSWAVLVVAFKDDPAPSSALTKYNRVFTSTGTGTMNMVDYFSDMSHGKLDLSGEPRLRPLRPRPAPVGLRRQRLPAARRQAEPQRRARPRQGDRHCCRGEPQCVRRCRRLRHTRARPVRMGRRRCRAVRRQQPQAEPARPGDGSRLRPRPLPDLRQQRRLPGPLGHDEHGERLHGHASDVRRGRPGPQRHQHEAARLAEHRPHPLHRPRSRGERDHHAPTAARAPPARHARCRGGRLHDRAAHPLALGRGHPAGVRARAPCRRQPQRAHDGHGRACGSRRRRVPSRWATRAGCSAST